MVEFREKEKNINTVDPDFLKELEAL